jgi:outer membrane receptor for ferrienterochelin and colicin
MVFSGGHQNAWSNRESLQYMNLLWEKVFDDDSSWQARWAESYIARDKMKNYFTADYRTSFNVADVRSREEILEIQHNFLRDRHNIVWGADYTRDIYTSSSRSALENTIPEDFANDQGSAFIEDEITLADNLWYTLGYRGQYNELTHYDWAGSTALVWEFTPKHFLRGAISRSFRRPTMWQEFRSGAIDYVGSPAYPDGLRIDGEGNDSLRNEHQVSYEIGYRGQWRKNLSVNIEGYIDRDSDMMAKQLLVQQSQPWLPGSDWVENDYYNQWENVYNVTTYGLETSIEWEPYEWWLIRGFYVYTHQTDRNQLTNWRTGETGIFLSPKHRVGLTNRFYLDSSTTLNTQLYWTDTATQSLEFIHGRPFWRLDVRLAKSIWNDSAEIAIGATNLIDNSHPEGGYGDWPSGGQPALTEVPRQLYFQFFYKF